MAPAAAPSGAVGPGSCPAREALPRPPLKKPPAGRGQRRTGGQSPGMRPAGPRRAQGPAAPPGAETAPLRAGREGPGARALSAGGAPRPRQGKPSRAAQGGGTRPGQGGLSLRGPCSRRGARVRRPLPDHGAPGPRASASPETQGATVSTPTRGSSGAFCNIAKKGLPLQNYIT